MKATLLTLAGMFAGLLVSFILVVLVEGFSAMVHPFPSDFQGTKEEICQHVERYPAWVLVVAVPMWMVCGFAGTWVARRIGGLYPAAIVGLLLALALGFNLSMLPYPIWFKVACLVTIPAMILAAASGRRRLAPAGA